MSRPASSFPLAGGHYPGRTPVAGSARARCARPRRPKFVTLRATLFGAVFRVGHGYEIMSRKPREATRRRSVPKKRCPRDFGRDSAERLATERAPRAAAPSVFSRPTSLRSERDSSLRRGISAAAMMQERHLDRRVDAARPSRVPRVARSCPARFIPRPAVKTRSQAIPERAGARLHTAPFLLHLGHSARRLRLASPRASPRSSPGDDSVLSRLPEAAPRARLTLSPLSHPRHRDDARGPATPDVRAASFERSTGVEPPTRRARPVQV
ncbi:hypothetical protein KM043_012312 [Ampulex compressa]|nr:hypothetical protein KM043_012312 [Ampulex compressa]